MQPLVAAKPFYQFSQDQGLLFASAKHVAIRTHGGLQQPSSTPAGALDPTPPEAAPMEEVINSVDAQLMLFDLLTKQPQQQPPLQPQPALGQQQYAQPQQAQVQPQQQNFAWQVPGLPAAEPFGANTVLNQAQWTLQQQFLQPHQQFVSSHVQLENSQQVYMEPMQALQQQAAAQQALEQQQGVFQFKMDPAFMQEQQQPQPGMDPLQQQRQQQQQAWLQQGAPQFKQPQPLQTRPSQTRKLQQQQQQMPLSPSSSSQQTISPTSGSSLPPIQELLQPQQQQGSHGQKAHEVPYNPSDKPAEPAVSKTRGGGAGGTRVRAAASAAAAPAAPSILSAGFVDGEEDGDEPEMQGMTVMQRYHRRRKMNMLKMEKEVEMKMAHLNLLEQENKHLKWQAHILENMLADIDKQLEVICSSDMFDADQWLTLLGMSSKKGLRNTRRLHLMLEGAAKTNIDGWTVDDCVSRWNAYVAELQPLLAEVEELRAAYLSEQQQQQKGRGAGKEQQQQQQQEGRPKRAAAKAAAAVLAEATSMMNYEEEQGPAAAGAEASATAALEQGEEMGAMQGSPRELQRAPSDTSSGCSSGLDVGGKSTTSSSQPVGEVDGQTVWGGPGTEGIPLPLLARVEDLVMCNFYWLLAIMTRAPLLTFQFISTDMEGKGRKVPPRDDPFWLQITRRLPMSVDQMQEASLCLSMAERCMQKVYLDREEVSKALQQEQTMDKNKTLLPVMHHMDDQLAAVDRMEKSMRREAVVRNMVGFYNINVFTQLDLARISVYSYPFFCGAWSVVGALDKRLKLDRQAAMEAAAGGSTRCTRVTRSRARSQAGAL
jgi:hypothetical protein